jgi:putative transposase
VLDEYTKRIVGYALSYHHTKEFVLEALKNALENTGKIPHYFHSDQGSEYTSFLVLQYLANKDITPSMSRKWSPWENWAQESYYGKFKLELWSPKEYATMEILILAIHRRIHYYNYDRLHTKLRNTPVWFERKYDERQQQFLSLSHHT